MAARIPTNEVIGGAFDFIGVYALALINVRSHGSIALRHVNNPLTAVDHAKHVALAKMARKETADCNSYNVSYAMRARHAWRVCGE